MNFQKLLYPLSVNIAIVAFWTTFVDHDNTNYFWTNHAIGIATAINVCQVISDAFCMFKTQTNNDKFSRPITVSDIVKCIHVIGKIDMKMLRTYKTEPEPEPEPLMDKGWCDLDDTNILCDKRRTFGENIDYYESNDEDAHDDKLFRKKRVVKRKVEDVLNEVEQEVLNEVKQDVLNEVKQDVLNEVKQDVLNEVKQEEQQDETNVDNEGSNKVDAEGSNKVDAESSNKAETNVDNEGSTNVETKDAEYVVVE